MPQIVLSARHNYGGQMLLMLSASPCMQARFSKMKWEQGRIAIRPCFYSKNCIGTRINTDKHGFLDAVEKIHYVSFA